MTGVTAAKVGMDDGLCNPVSEPFVLIANATRQVGPEAVQILTLALHSLQPFGQIDAEQLAHPLVRQVEPLAIDCRKRRNKANCSFGRLSPSIGAVENPLQNSKI